MVLFNASSMVQGGVKPVANIFSEDICELAQNFFTRIELTTNFLLKIFAKISKQYAPKSPMQYGIFIWELLRPRDWFTMRISSFIERSGLST